jgi:hypothetical protein
MRKKIALAGLGLGLAASFLPVSSASAACVPAWWQTITGDCSPCQTVGPAVRYLHDHGVPTDTVQCVA